VLQTRRRTNGDYAGAKFDADGHIVVGDEAAFAESYR